MEENTANPKDVLNENVEEETTNSQEEIQGTQENENSTNESSESVAQEIDYYKKFSESSREAQRLLDETKEKEAELERLKEENSRFREALEQNEGSKTEDDKYLDALYPGSEYLDEESRRNLIAYSNMISKKTKAEVEESIKNDPAIAFAMRQYSENKFNSAFSKTLEKYPDLGESKEDFKAKYYNPSNVPDNIEDILEDLAKIYLFDKAKYLGAKEEEEKSKRFDLERNTSGPREPSVKRTLDDWNRMARENPVQFAKLSEEFKADMESGKI